MKYQQKEESLIMPEIKKRINPYKMFNGSFIPEWLEVRTEISPGAKLIYARLARFSGKNGKCNPKMETLAESLGTNKRQIVRFIDELRDSNLIERKRNGLNRSNDYFFLKIKWMNLDIEQSDNLSLQETTNLSLQETTNLSLPYNKNKESHLRESIEESTPLNPPRGKGKSKKKFLSLEDFFECCGKTFTLIHKAQMLKPLLKPLEEFYEYRKDVINSPFKSKMGVTKMVKQLSKYSNGNVEVAIEMIDRTIASEKWPGIYPVNGNGKQSNKPEKEKKPDPYGEGDENPYHNLF